MTLLNKPTQRPTSNQLSGTTTHHHQLPFQTPSHNLPTMTNTPPTSGNPGANGRITPSPPAHPILRVGSIIPNHQPMTFPPTTHPPDLSLHTLQATIPPTTNLVDLHIDPVPSNLVHPPMFLQDMLPSISTQDPDKTWLAL